MDRTLTRSRAEEERKAGQSRGGKQEAEEDGELGNERGEDRGERCLWSNRRKGEVRKTPGMRRVNSEEVLMLQDGDRKWLAGQETPQRERERGLFGRTVNAQ